MPRARTSPAAGTCTPRRGVPGTRPRMGRGGDGRLPRPRRRPPALRRAGSERGVKGWGRGPRGPEFRRLSVSPPPARPPPRPAPRVFTRRLSLPQPGRANHNIHLSIAGPVPGGPARCQGRLRGTGAGGAQLLGKGHPLALAPPKTPFGKRAQVGLGVGGIRGSPARGGRECGAESKGGPPFSAPPPPPYKSGEQRSRWGRRL